MPPDHDRDDEPRQPASLDDLLREQRRPIGPDDRSRPRPPDFDDLDRELHHPANRHAPDRNGPPAERPAPRDDLSRERGLSADADDLRRERRLPAGPGDRGAPPPTSERFLPPRRGVRNSRDDEGWYAAELAGRDDSPSDAEYLARRGMADPEPDEPGWGPTAGSGRRPGSDAAGKSAGPGGGSRDAVSNSAGPADGSRDAAAGGAGPGRGSRDAAGGSAESADGARNDAASAPRRTGGGTRGAAGRSRGDAGGSSGALGGSSGSAGGASGVGGGSSGAAEATGGGGAGSTLDSAGSEAQKGAEGASGPDLARAVLDAALAKRRENAARHPRRRSGSGEGGEKRLRGYSGPGPDPRDPQPFGKVLERLMKARGWEKPKAEATVFGAWEKVVGPEIAAHSRPVKLDAGVLTVEAESTAWATQLRLLTATLLRNIAGEVGHNVVTRLNIHGPAAPSWSRGPRRVQGRGPRDTYG